MDFKGKQIFIIKSVVLFYFFVYGVMNYDQTSFVPQVCTLNIPFWTIYFLHLLPTLNEIWFDNTTSHKIYFNIPSQKQRENSFILSYVSSTGKSYDGFSKKLKTQREQYHVMYQGKGRFEHSQFL